MAKESINRNNNRSNNRNTNSSDDIKQSPDISIIIPVYNVENYLKRCLDSIINNTYKNIEIICVDNGSTDGSMKILKFYEKKDDRIVVLKQLKRGPSAARNMGLDNAKGKYISFVDADDFVSFNAYEILMEVAEKHKLDMVIFGANDVPWNNAPEWITRIINTRYKFYKNCNGSKIVFQEPACRPFLWMHFVKRELFEMPTKIRFDETMMLGEDQLLQFQYIPRAKNIMVIEDKLYNYQISRSGSLMQLYSSRKIRKIETHLILVKKILEHWEKDGEFWKEEDELLTWMINFLYYSIVNLPMVYKKKYAKEILLFLQENNFSMCLLFDWEQPRYKELQEWSESTINEKNYKKEIIDNIRKDKYQIKEILNSKCFKVGRMLTKKEERLNIEEYYTLFK